MKTKLQEKGLYDTVIRLVPAVDFDKDPVRSVGKAVLCLIIDGKHKVVPKLIDVLNVEQRGDVRYDIQEYLAPAFENGSDQTFQRLTNGYFMVKDMHHELERAICV